MAVLILDAKERLFILGLVIGLLGSFFASWYFCCLMAEKHMIKRLLFSNLFFHIVCLPPLMYRIGNLSLSFIDSKREITAASSSFVRHHLTLAPLHDLLQT